jgi:hypothetical protein
MEADLDRSFPGWRGPHRSHEPSLEDRLIARMLAPWLDRELAERRGGEFSEAHAARAEQLASERTRRSLASTLDRLIERAENPPRASRTIPSLFAGVPPCRDQVREATTLIVSIAAGLRSGEPLDPRGVARLKTLLADRSGPCYTSSRPDALAAALREAAELLEPGR